MTDLDANALADQLKRHLDGIPERRQEVTILLTHIAGALIEACNELRAVSAKLEQLLERIGTQTDLDQL